VVALTRELLFVNPFDPNPSKVMTAPYSVSGDPSGPTRRTPGRRSACRACDTPTARTISIPDGTRIAAAPLPDQTGVMHDRLVFIFNFPEYLSALMSAKK
jgi:hypothetical protein